jgi:hypothetical protein
MPVINRRASELLSIPHSAAGGARSLSPRDSEILNTDDVGVDRTYEQVRADGRILEVQTHPLATGGVVPISCCGRRADAQIIHSFTLATD